MVGYLFGGSTGETAATLRRKRVAEALQRRQRMPQNVGEGIAAMGEAIADGIKRKRQTGSWAVPRRKLFSLGG